ncbi:MAG TPA: aspartate-semialdehyde dehydrogenase [Spirochaetaceae bacterium]|nr:aspartate-semialdehyde dehydrogenase [Spirochaetaceae bacterium]
MTRIPVTVLGATGVVGQRFVRRLANHPLFELCQLAASERSSGKRYDEACEWRLGGEPYAGFGASLLAPCEPEKALSPIVFSALDAGPARDIEPAFAAAGALVFSNASAFRMEADVPLIVPELNAAHLVLIKTQKARRGWKGAIVCNPNCTTTVALGALGPLYRAFGMELAMLTSMQAISGAGYPGVSALDILGNVIPFIRGEEEKVEEETRKILGTLRNQAIEPAGFAISAQCNRVSVADGHTLCISARLGGAPEPDDVMQALLDFVPDSAAYALHSAPHAFLELRGEADRPQPRHDVESGGGMTLQIGRIRACPVLGAKLVVLGHNAERGAAGGSILNAELAVAGGYL